MQALLSDRELQALKLFGSGLTGPQVRVEMSKGLPQLLSAKTMCTYTTRLKEKIAKETGLHQVTMEIAVLWGMRMGLVPIFKFPNEDRLTKNPELEMAYILATHGNSETVKVEKGQDGVITITITPPRKKEA